MFWSRFGINVVVVLEGMRPEFLAGDNQTHEISTLKKSHRIWEKVQECKTEKKDSQQTNDVIFKSILAEYGSRFYMQEVINATKECTNCTFFVAPFLQTPQLAQFYADSLIQCAFGTSKLLIHADFE